MSKTEVKKIHKMDESSKTNYMSGVKLSLSKGYTPVLISGDYSALYLVRRDLCIMLKIYLTLYPIIHMII